MQKKNKETINPDILQDVESLVSNTEEGIRKEGGAVFARYPFTFSLLGTLGIVAVLHGFEGVIDRVPFLKDRPLFVLLFGLVVLIISGGLYKHLKKH